MAQAMCDAIEKAAAWTIGDMKNSQLESLSESGEFKEESSSRSKEFSSKSSSFKLVSEDDRLIEITSGDASELFCWRDFALALFDPFIINLFTPSSMENSRIISVLFGNYLANLGYIRWNIFNETK